MKDYSEDQLQPMKTPHSNSVLKGPPDTDVGNLDCELGPDDDGHMVTASAWNLTQDQRNRIAAGAHLRMSVWQHPIPPLALAVEAPFCGACDREMSWDSRFFCETPDCPAPEVFARRDPVTPEEQLRQDFSPE